MKNQKECGCLHQVESSGKMSTNKFDLEKREHGLKGLADEPVAVPVNNSDRRAAEVIARWSAAPRARCRRLLLKLSRCLHKVKVE